MVGSPSLARLARFVLRHRRLVIGCWLVLLVAGGLSAGRVSKRLSFDFSLPGQPGYETAKQIESTYGNGGEAAPSILVVTVPRGQNVSGDQPVIAAALQRVRDGLPQLRVVDYAATRDPRFVTADGKTTYAYAFAPRPKGMGAPTASGAAVRLLDRALPQGYAVSATGLEELSSGGGGQSGPGIFSETLLAGLGALAVLAFVF